MFMIRVFGRKGLFGLDEMPYCIWMHVDEGRILNQFIKYSHLMIKSILCRTNWNLLAHKAIVLSSNCVGVLFQYFICELSHGISAVPNHLIFIAKLIARALNLIYFVRSNSIAVNFLLFALF